MAQGKCSKCGYCFKEPHELPVPVKVPGAPILRLWQERSGDMIT